MRAMDSTGRFETTDWELGMSKLQRTFKDVSSVAKQLVLKKLRRTDRHLIELINFSLDDQNLSEYPFVLKYSFCDDELGCRRIRTVTAAVHLFQSSAFIMDDIFDSGTTRYNKETVNRRYDVNYAIIAGELLQTAAVEEMTSQLEREPFRNRAAALRLFNEIIRENYLGQYLDLYNGSSKVITPRAYYRMIGLTTGRFLGNVAKLGALLGGRSGSCIKSLAQFGFNYGMALQITDDIIDLTERRDVTGKTFACDLKSRKMRLPMIEALRLSSGREAEVLRNFMGSRRSGVGLRQVLRLIEDCGALKACQATARRYVARALNSLDSTKNRRIRENLRWLAESLFSAQMLA
jgi:geranylgeranyl pyrophosphate synthase